MMIIVILYYFYIKNNRLYFWRDVCILVSQSAKSEFSSSEFNRKQPLKWQCTLNHKLNILVIIKSIREVP